MFISLNRAKLPIPSQRNLLPDNEASRIDGEDSFFSMRKSSDDIRMKATEIRKNEYFGKAKIAGE